MDKSEVVGSGPFEYEFQGNRLQYAFKATCPSNYTMETMPENRYQDGIYFVSLLQTKIGDESEGLKHDYSNVGFESRFGKSVSQCMEEYSKEQEEMSRNTIWNWAKDIQTREGLANRVTLKMVDTLEDFTNVEPPTGLMDGQLPPIDVKEHNSRLHEEFAGWTTDDLREKARVGPDGEVIWSVYSPVSAKGKSMESQD
ncbi:uncharacterized protein L201_006183 [Kwoniella dendrophila CBS 6074]|uniref:Uncharacterized protein n=1 Tax=Kwoniella dendrophila CBS 6074 TaxID=1295534 RepID=A0AAX4K0I4_9TREE